MEFTDKQKLVIDKLIEMYDRFGEPIGPTQVGLELGYDYNTASSKCYSALKKAVTMGIVEKVKGGKYLPVRG